jgi:hypothetical protein
MEQKLAQAVRAEKLAQVARVVWVLPKSQTAGAAMAAAAAVQVLQLMLYVAAALAPDNSQVFVQAAGSYV